MVKENIAKEKLRIIDTIRENAGLVITIGGFVWMMFQFLIIPIYKLQFQMQNILDNHLATIQTELSEAKSERKAQGVQIGAVSELVIRLQVLMESK